MQAKHSPDALFPAHLESIAARATAALEASGYDALLVHSGSLRLIPFDDRAYPFRAHAQFLLWAPVGDSPDSFIWFQPGSRPRLLFHSPVDYWHKGAQLPAEPWVQHFDVTPVADLEAARRALPADLSRVAILAEPDALAGWAAGAVNPAALVSRLDYARARKTPYELACFRESSRLGAIAHRAAEAAWRAGASEFEVEQAFIEAVEVRENELPYNPIIAFNEGGAILHYQVLERRAPAVRRSMLIDAGVDFRGYGSDITRTYGADRDFGALIARMEEVQLSLCSGVKAGVDWRDMHLSAHRLIAELLHDAGVITQDAEEAVESGLSGIFLPHGLGHLLGLYVHDVGGLQASPEGGIIPRPEGHPALRLTRVLEEGFVVTMEPGLYFIDSLLESARASSLGRHIVWERVAQFAPYGGIRIEDDLAVTATGCENLTRDAFRATAGAAAAA